LKLTATKSFFATRNNLAKNGSFGFHEIVQKLIHIVMEFDIIMRILNFLRMC